MLNSLQGLSREELLGFDCQTWINPSNGEKHNYGWPELFFTAGLLLRGEDSVGWHEMASAILGIGKHDNVDVASLFEHYAGKNLFTKSVNSSVRTDQLKKGARVTRTKV
jgi:hypothetical protein